jgi:hypothetical protein
MQVVLPEDVVPEAAPISLMHRLTAALIGLAIQPPAVRWPAAKAVTAVPPVTTLLASSATSVTAPAAVRRLPWLSACNAVCWPVVGAGGVLL